MVRRSAYAIALVALLAACSTADPSSSASEPAAGSVSPDSSVEPAVSQPIASAAAGTCTPPVLCGEELTPGEYGSTSSGSEMTFTVGEEGWRGTEYEGLGFDLFRLGDGPFQGMSAVPYAGVVYADVCSGVETEEIGATPADFVAFIAGVPGITPRGESTEVTIGGVTGVQIDVDAADPGCVSDPPERLWLWDLAGVTDFHVNVGEAARFIALDGETGVIVFVIETLDPSAFDTLLEMLQPVLDSMTFG